MPAWDMLNIERINGHATGKFNGRVLADKIAQKIYARLMCAAPVATQCCNMLRICRRDGQIEIDMYQCSDVDLTFRQYATVDGADAHACYEALYGGGQDPPLPVMVQFALNKPNAPPQ